MGLVVESLIMTEKKSDCLLLGMSKSLLGLQVDSEQPQNPSEYLIVSSGRFLEAQKCVRLSQVLIALHSMFASKMRLQISCIRPVPKELLVAK